MLVSASAGVLLGMQAFAQEAENKSSGGLEEVVVTAQKRQENVQETPLAVTAISGDALESKGISEVRELSRIDAALQIGQATGVVTTFIRGVGNPVTTAGNEASVPVYIDDVYFIRAATPFFNLSSVERVEVLKGPQGTLFGRNASGGVISIYTRDPDFSAPEAEVRVGYGNYETVDLKGYLNLPISDRVAANLAVSYHDQGEGWGRNRQLVDPSDTSLGFAAGGNDYWKDRSVSVRGKLLAQLTDSTTVKLISYYEDSRNEIGFYSRPFPGTVGGTPDGAHNGFANTPNIPQPAQVMPRLGFYDVSLPEGNEQYDESEGSGFSARIDQEFGFADLVSITAYRKNEEIYFANGNYSPYDWAYYDLNIVDEQLSQELQLKSQPNAKIEWILGAYYLDADGGFDPTHIHGPAVQGLGLSAIDLYGEQNVKSYAGFGQLTYPVLERTNITAGLRYTVDQVEGNGHTVLNFLPGVFGPDALSFTDQIFDANNNCSNILAAMFFDPSLLVGECDADNREHRPKFTKLTWKGAIDQQLSDDAMIYGSVSRGYKSGTFNTLPLDSVALEPEVVDVYEVGLKSELLGNRLRFNMAVFLNDIENPQVQAQRNGLVFLKNAGSARTRGFEFDATAAVGDGWTLRLAGTYLDAKFRDFPDAPAYCPSPTVSAAQCAILSSNPPLAAGNLNTIAVDAKGHELPYASKWKFTSSINYELALAGAGTLLLDLTGNYATRFNWDADNVIKEPAHFLFDGSIALTPTAMDNLTLRFWMKNITDEENNLNYYAQASGSAFSSAPGAPRTFGGEVVVAF